MEELKSYVEWAKRLKRRDGDPPVSERGEGAAVPQEGGPPPAKPLG